MTKFLFAVLVVCALAQGQTTITVGSINKTVFADQYKRGSSTGGIAEAYSSCPSTGCNVVLGADITITTPQTITIADNKPLTINMAGRKITAANASGIGLTFTDHDINTRTRFTLKDGALTCSWTNSSLTGFKFSAMTEVYLERVDLSTCDHSGIGIIWDDVEDAHWGGGSVRFNSLAFQAQNATNQNSVYNVHFDSNVNAVLLKDVGGITFADCLVQSNTGQHAFSATTTAGNNATELRIQGCHFENNGDGTAASRNLYIAPFAGQAYLNVQLIGNIFSQGAFAPGSNAIEIAGSQNVQPLLTMFNQYNGYGTTPTVTGEVLSRHVIIGENGGTNNADVMLGMPNANGDTGIMLNPVGASKCYNIFAGHPSDFQGFLQFWDCTANTSILSYNSGTWTFPTAALFNGTFNVAGAAAFTNLVDFSAATINSGLPIGATDSGNIIVSKNSSASNATQFVLKHNLNNVELDNQRGSFIFGQAVAYPHNNVAVVNGGNNNVAITITASGLPTTFIRLTGPTAAFSTTGFTPGIAGGASPIDGQRLMVFNTVGFAWTIANENAGSTASWRITTLTGADVTLRAGTSFATFIYDGTTSRWLLTSTN